MSVETMYDNMVKKERVTNNEPRPELLDWEDWEIRGIPL
jgi:hypothetical protein